MVPNAARILRTHGASGTQQSGGREQAAQGGFEVVLRDASNILPRRNGLPHLPFAASGAS